MEKTAMTNREFFTAIAAVEALPVELREFATASIEKLDHTNELRKEAVAKKSAEKAAEKAPIREAVVACITDEPKTATILIAEAGVEIKPQAVPSLLKGLVEDGTLNKVDVKVTGKGTQKAYVRA